MRTSLVHIVARFSMLWLMAGLCLEAADLPKFREHILSKELKMGYQLVVSDLNGDSKKDLIAVDERATELVWFENPSWSRHILATDVPRPINADCADFDGDGIPEVALAFRFETSPEKSVGSLALLKASKDVRQPWTAREIDRVPTAHRVRWIDPEGKGKKILLLGPLVGLKARPPLYEDIAPLYLYRPSEWKREILSSELRGILHANNPANWDNHKHQDLLTAGFQGIHRFELRSEKWISTLIAKGDPRPCPECGSSEVQLGHLKRRQFLAAIEPWHGNQVVAYILEGKKWLRIVIEDAMVNGHALAVGDLNGDGLDEIVGGFRGKGFQLSVYRSADAQGKRWLKTILDSGGIAAADCKIADLTGDGRLDIACIGASTGNIKLYENLGP